MDKDNEKILTSQALTEELNAERREKGLYEIQPINCRKGSTGTYARKDKSFSNTFDFYRKLFGKKDK